MPNVDVDLEATLADNTFDRAVVVRGSGIKVPTIFSSIQDAIDAASTGDTISVYPGTYDQDEANDRDLLNGGAGTTDLNIFVDKCVTIQGVDGDGNPVTDANDVQAFVVPERDTPLGNLSTIFVQADNVTISGLDVTAYDDPDHNFKTISVIGDNPTIKDCKLHALDQVSSIYMYDPRYNSTADTSYIQSYAFEHNYLDAGGIDAAGVRISSGPGWSGDVADRVIGGNTFDLGSYGIEFVGPGGDSWDVYPVGAATITGNSFSGQDKGSVVAWGKYKDAVGYGDLDWDEIFTGNTFDKSVIVKTPGDDVRYYDYTGGPPNFYYVRGIYSAIQRYPINVVAQAGDTVMVGTGVYSETVTVKKSVNLIGAGCAQTIWRGTAITDRSLVIVRDNSSPASIHVEITGFSFETENNQTIRGDWSTSYAQALTLDIHDNCFAHVNTRNPGNDFALYVDGANQIARGSEGAIRVYDNTFDVVTGGVLFEYCRAVDVINNVFDVTYEGVTFNYYGTSGTCGEQMVKGNIFTHVPVDWAFAMNNWHGSGSYTVLPSEVCNNVVTDTGFAYAIAYGVEAHQSQAHDFTIRDNAFLSGTIIVWGDYASEILLNASGNWWGSSDSPAGRINTAGTVDYTPWLDSGDDTKADPGFQGDFSTLWVDDDSPQTGTVGRIQEGIDMASGSTVNVLPGTYDEQLTIDKSLTLVGSGEDQTFVKAAGSPVITVSADDVTIQDLEITDDPYLIEGIRIVSGASTGLTVDHVDFTDLGAGTGANAYGIYIATSFANLSVTDCDFVPVTHTTYYRTIGVFAPNNLDLSDFEVTGSTFRGIWTGIYLRSAIDGLDVTGSTFGQVQSSEFAACVSGIYIGDGSDYNFDIENVTVSSNTFTDYGRGVYVWNYANNGTISNFDVSGNNFTNSVWSSAIRFIGGNEDDEGVSFDGISVHDNVFTQNATVGAHVALIDFRTYSELADCDIAVTDNDITLSGGPYTDPWTGILLAAWEGPLTNTLIDGNVLNGGNCGGAGAPASTGILIRHQASDYWPSGTLEVDITNNEITGFDHGVGVYDDSAAQHGGLPTGCDVDINYNEIAGNALYGVVNGVGEVADATYNWWGDASGPFHATLNSDGTANAVSDNVLFEPWFGDEEMTILEPPSTYEFVYEVPELIVAAEEVVVPVTFETDDLGFKGYNDVRFKFAASGPGDVTFKATDSEEHEYTFLNSGYWGPASGFALPADYSATTDWSLNFSEPGEYTITFSLIEAPEGEVIAGIEGSQNVTVRAEDIQDYYRHLNEPYDEITTDDLLAAIDDWLADVVPPGFDEPISTLELLALIDEWLAS